MDSSKIRNFSIIAHIDHGKSTLADRLLETTGSVRTLERAQFLDSMELEQERGITIKAKAVRMSWKGHILNLLDTPGHVDFTFEVHRALWACEGVVLLVDASQGIQAQTVANCEIAQKSGLAILPVVNKIDLQNARVEETVDDMERILGLRDFPFLVSAKTGGGVSELLDGIVSKVPAPAAGPSAAAGAALIFDSYMDPFRGVILVVRVFEGRLAAKHKIRFFHDPAAKEYLAEEVGYLAPARQAAAELAAGEVGYLVCGLKDPKEVRHGETLLVVDGAAAPRAAPLKPLGAPLKPFVYVGMYPMQLGEVSSLQAALERLHLTDPSFEFNIEASLALGPGFRVGFLGLLHLEIIKERLKREFSQDVIITNPNVRYRVGVKKGETIEVISPAHFPAHGDITKVEEPYARVKILTPAAHLGAVQEMLKSRRGIHIETAHLTPQSIRLTWEIPLSELVVDFYDKLKAISQGYASLDYELAGYRFKEDLVKVDILIHGEPCDALSFIVPKEKAFHESRSLLERLRELVPRQMFEVALQASSQGKIIAKEKIHSIRKDVLAKCYGGDITRKMKLLEKQKEGKKRMRKLGRVDIPPEAFLTVLRKT
ncbi:MAG: elongation factor 4 [Elusimicrobia bacterium]|nr:elongation factor 4 [Elusimicrobiota bacterium]